MALTWKWDKKRGEVHFRQKRYDENEKEVMVDFVANIYEGNAPLVVIMEWKENGKDWYSPYLFFCDDTHAKRCLGIIKNVDGLKCNLYDEIYKIRIDKRHRDFKKIVQWFSQAFDEITIEVYTGKDGE